ncbi:MAG: DUF2142 domain-containing protein [Propionibacteriaceae bacterium]|nr:DUF2142 domain-containing protein [Propionibacteriaceae bacterium]
MAAVLAIVGGVATAFAWAVASPVGSSPDDDYHMASIWCPAPLDRSCSVRTDARGVVEVQVPAQVAKSSGCYSGDVTVSGACTTQIADVSVWTTRVNNGEYPGLYYTVMHVFVGEDVYQSVMVMRAVNGAIAIVLIGLVVVALPRSGRRLFAYSTLPVCVPMMIYLVASINPSGWALIGVAAAWFSMYAALVSRSQVRTVLSGVLAVVSAGLASSARSDAGSFLCLAAFVATILFWPRIRLNRWRLVLPVIVALVGLAGFLSGSQSGVLTAGFGGSGGTLILFAADLVLMPIFMIDFTAGVFGLNWVDTVMPPIVCVPVAILAVAMLIVGMRRLDWRKLVSFVAVYGVYFALPLYLFVRSGYMLGQGLQPRYMIPLLPILFGVALWRPDRGGARRWSLVQTVVLVAVLVFAQTIALHIQIQRFTSGLGSGSVNLNSNVEWWHAGPSPMATWILGSVGFAMITATLFILRLGGSSQVASGDLRSDVSPEEESSELQTVPASS